MIHKILLKAFTDRIVTRSILLIFAVIIAGCSCAFTGLTPGFQKTSWLILSMIAGLLGSLFSLVWLILEFTKTKTLVCCKRDLNIGVCQFVTDFVIAFSFGALSVLNVIYPNIYCNQMAYSYPLNELCGLFNSFISFGFISLPFYVAILYHDFKRAVTVDGKAADGNI